MAATKSATKAPAKAHYICDTCETEFNGTGGPNRKSTMKYVIFRYYQKSVC